MLERMGQRFWIINISFHIEIGRSQCWKANEVDIENEQNKLKMLTFYRYFYILRYKNNYSNLSKESIWLVNTTDIAECYSYPCSKKEPQPGKNSGSRENHKRTRMTKWKKTAFSANLFSSDIVNKRIYRFEIHARYLKLMLSITKHFDENLSI